MSEALRKKVSVFGVILVRIFPHSPNTETFHAEAYSKPCQTSKIKCFQKIVNDLSESCLRRFRDLQW